MSITRMPTADESLVRWIIVYVQPHFPDNGSKISMTRQSWTLEPSVDVCPERCEPFLTQKKSTPTNLTSQISGLGIDPCLFSK